MHTGKILRVLSIVLLLVLIGVILASRSWVESTEDSPARTPADADVSALKPDHVIRLFGATEGSCLVVLTPLNYLGSQKEVTRDWLIRALGESSREMTFLYLHFFVTKEGPRFSFDPVRDLVQLQLDSGLTVKNVDLARRLALLDLTPQDRLILAAEVPDRTVTLGPLAVGKVLIAFPAANAWPDVKTVRLIRKQGPVPLLPQEISFVDWERLVSGGPVPVALLQASTHPLR